MSELDDLLAACIAAPDDDAPRLVWADAVGGERGELVVIQCRLASEDLPAAERGALRKRADELLATSGAEWSGLGEAVRRCVFRRGFVDAVELDVMKSPWHTVAEKAPLATSLSITGLSSRIDYRDGPERQGPDAIAIVLAMLDQPAVRKLRGLEFDSCVIYELTGDSEWDFDSTSLGDQVCELIAATGKLAGIRALGIRDTFTPRGIHELLGSNALADVERLVFQFGEIDRSQAIDLFAAMPKLRAIDIHAAIDLAKLADAIPPSVVELRCFGLHGAAFSALAASPVAGSLERLQISGTGLAGGSFATFRKLRSLDVGYSSISEREPAAQNAAVRNFVTTSLPALRELRLFSYLTDEATLMIADAFGTQLEYMDLIGYDHITCVDELRTKIAGHVASGAYANPDTLLQVGVTTREPWIRYGLVTVNK